MPSRQITAHALLRSLDLVVDGPARWGGTVASRSSGIFIVELPSADTMAPLDIAAIRAWVERVPSMRVDGERATPGALADRLRSFWLPGQSVLYVGRSSRSLGARVAALHATPLGDRMPHSGGHWLRTLRGLDALRIWWAETDAPEEYEDAAASAVAETITDRERAALPAMGPLLPWANLESAGGERRATGITGSLLDAPTRSGSPPAGGAAPTRAAAPRTGSARATSARPAVRAGGAATRRASTSATTPPARPLPAPTHVTASGLAQLRQELGELVEVRRPEVVARVKHARELGDLRENADYEAARREQSFLEGRIRALEQLIRSAQVIDADHTGEVMLGATVVAMVEDDEVTLHIVGSTEADPASGRISNHSPVGRALLGHRAGDEVVVHTPARTLHYRIVEVRQLEG